MSSDGDDDPQSPSAFLEAPSSQSVIVDADPSTSRSNHETTNASESDQDSSEEERENRFNGPASTWRDYTADERGLIASLDQERASDLSVHLYNAHALKSRLYNQESADASKPWHSKHHWIKPDEDGSTPWYPDVNWTAWPLRAEDVPRKSENFGRDALEDDSTDGTIKMSIPWRAGADLNDEVLALMLRKAKERFILRSKTQCSSPDQRLSATRSPSQRRSSPPVDSRPSSVASEATFHESDSGTGSIETEEYIAPGLMLDDDEAKRLLGQSSRHALTMFDNMLMGLHRSRQYHTSGSTTDIKPAHCRPPKRKRRSTTNETPAPLTYRDNDEDQERTQGRDYSKHPSGKNPLYPRDWSEVLGVASLTGWNHTVIDRAAKRCSALFGEEVLLKTMPETAAGKAKDRLTRYVPEMIPDLDEVDDDLGEEEGWINKTEVGFKCPESSCAQHNRSYEKRFMIRQHLRRVHKYGQEALDAYDQMCAPQDAKPSTEHLETDGRENKDEKSGDNEPSVAVTEHGFMEPVEVHLGRGLDVQGRRKRGEART
jgi:hypothetical protein